MKTRRHRRTRCAKSLAIDLGWSRTNWSRTAVAWTDARNGRVKVDLLGPDDWIEDWIRDLLLPEAVVGLDIPVYGCEVLGEEQSFRRVDRAMIKVGVPLLPSSSAGGFGSEIAARIKEIQPDCQVVEVYPYAVLRVLWSLYQSGDERPAKRLNGTDWSRLLGAQSWRHRPPKYKRAKGRPALAQAMRKVTEVFGGTPYGQALDRAFDDPFSVMRRTDLDRVTDAFDALLGLLALDLYAASSPYARVFGVPGHGGELFGIADTWLWERWVKAARELAVE